MQNGGGAAEDLNAAAPTKRVRRPNVRLHQPYYEYSGSRTLQQQWKDLEGARKPRTHRPQNVKTSKKIRNCHNREGIKELLSFEDDDDVAIGSWKKLNAGKRDRDSKSKSKRKRIRPTESHENEDDEKNDDFTLSNDGDSEKEENLDANGGNLVNFEPEDSDFNDDDKNVVGVGTWLTELGLGKYLPVFEVHEVDDEVLPFLTIEDLKDMGISAVGSRRKMYCSIQKLGKKF